MRNSLIAIVIPVILLISCGKDKFDTRPSLEFKSASVTEVIPATPVDLTPNLVLSFEFTDKEGDLADAVIGVRKVVSNCEMSGFEDLVSYKIPAELPETSNLRGTVDLIFPYFKINPLCPTYPLDEYQGDSAIFYVWVTDHAGNVSDTVSSGLIKIRKQ